MFARQKRGHLPPGQPKGNAPRGHRPRCARKAAPSPARRGGTAEGPGGKAVAGRRERGGNGRGSSREAFAKARGGEDDSRPRHERGARAAAGPAPRPRGAGGRAARGRTAAIRSGKAPLKARAARLRPGGASAGQRLELGARGEPARRRGAASAAGAAPPAPLLAEDLPFSGHLLRNSEADVALVRSPTRTSVTNAPFLVPNDTRGPGGRPPLGFTLGISKQVAIFRRNPRKAPLSLRPMRQPPPANRPPGSLRGDEPAKAGRRRAAAGGKPARRRRCGGSADAGLRLTGANAGRGRQPPSARTRPRTTRLSRRGLIAPDRDALPTRRRTRAEAEGTTRKARPAQPRSRLTRAHGRPMRTRRAGDKDGSRPRRLVRAARRGRADGGGSETLCGGREGRAAGLRPGDANAGQRRARRERGLREDAGRQAQPARACG